jgi:hypothetical protein
MHTPPSFSSLSPYNNNNNNYYYQNNNNHWNNNNSMNHTNHHRSHQGYHTERRPGRRGIPMWTSWFSGSGSSGNGSSGVQQQQQQRSLSSSSSSSSSSHPLSLSLWHTVVATIPLSHILPIGFGNTTDIANVQAFFGDKRMHMEIAKLLRHHHPPNVNGGGSNNTLTTLLSSSSSSSLPLPALGTVTALQGLAMSNQLLSSCITEILPYHLPLPPPPPPSNDDDDDDSEDDDSDEDSDEDDEDTIMTTTKLVLQGIRDRGQIHDGGTMIEAAIDAVANITTTSSSAASSSTAPSSISSSSSSSSSLHNNDDHNDDDDDHTITTTSSSSSSSSSSSVVITKAMADAAIVELAHYLIQQAIRLQQQQQQDVTDAFVTATTTKTTSPSPSDDDKEHDEPDDDIVMEMVDMINPKGQLLEVGGMVESKRLDGYPDHAPQYTATASIDDITGTVNYGRSKREAEQSAASMVWRYYSKLLQKRNKKNSTSTTTVSTSTAVAATAAATDWEDTHGIENPKGRILSIGGTVTSEKLPDYPEHLPRFHATCKKTFFIVQHAMTGGSNSNSGYSTAQKASYTIAATAEGRTKFEAERIASVIVWRHVMNMPTTPNAKNTNPMLTTTTTNTNGTNGISDMTTIPMIPNDTTIDSDMDDDDDDDDDQPVEKEYQSAKERKRIRNLKKYEKKQISKFEVRLSQSNFLHYKLEEQPILNLRPGGETVIESWYRGALHPQAAFHRALVAPHVFPHHIGTVNAWTRQNVIYDDSITTPTTTSTTDTSTTTTSTDSTTDTTTNPSITGTTENSSTGTSDLDDMEHRSEDTVDDALECDDLDHDDEDHHDFGRDDDRDLGLRRQRDDDRDLGRRRRRDDDDRGLGRHDEWRDSRDKEKPPPTTTTTTAATANLNVAMKTYTVLAVVVPNLEHPLVVQLGKDYNSSELLTKCFVEHGRTPREARTKTGLAVNRYIMDVLLKDFDYLSAERDQKKKLSDSGSSVLSKAERKRIFFKF